jgi:Tol biopolymer transport system component
VAFTERSQRTRAWSLPFDAKTGRISGRGQPVTAADRDAWMPALSPDSKKLAFIAQRSGRQEFWDQSLQEVWVKSLGDGSETLIAGGDGFSRNRPNWSRDGRQLAYARFRPVNPEHTRLEFSIVVVPAAGGEEKELFSALGPMGDVALDWSPDGASILENTETLTHGRFLLSLLPIAAAPHAEASRKVVTGSPNYNLWQAEFSLDGRWITFCAVDAPGGTRAGVYVVPASGGPWVQITEGKYWDDKPRWSPDGRAIYFVSNRTGFYNVWGIRFDRTSGKPTGEPFRVTNFQSPSQMISPVLASMEMSLTNDRLVIDITQVSGNIWMLENIAHD